MHTYIYKCIHTYTSTYIYIGKGGLKIFQKGGTQEGGSFEKGGYIASVKYIFLDMSWSVHIDNEKEDILILGICSTQVLDDTMLSATAQYSINFSRSSRKSCLSLHYNGTNSFLFFNASKIYWFKAKDSEIKKYSLGLGNISGDFSSNNMKKRD